MMFDFFVVSVSIIILFSDEQIFEATGFKIIWGPLNMKCQYVLTTAKDKVLQGSLSPLCEWPWG